MVFQVTNDREHRIFAKNDFEKFSKYGYLPIHLACYANNLVMIEIIINLIKSQQRKNCI